MRPLLTNTERVRTRSRRRSADEPARAEDAARMVDAGLAGLVGSLHRPIDGLEPNVAPPAAHPVERPAVERATEQLIDQVASNVVLLHHRRTLHEQRAIDHLVIAPSGVWIIHSRRDHGRIATRKPMFGAPSLTIGGRRRSDLLAGLAVQTADVAGALSADHPDVAVRSAICFVDTECPLLPTLHLGSYLFFGTPAIVRHLNSDGPLGAARVQVVADVVEAGFPPA